MRITKTPNFDKGLKFWEDNFTDEDAAVYMDNYGEGVGTDTRKKLSKLIDKGSSVLDVGCGPGWNFDHFLEYGPSVKYRGIDYSKRFVRVANKRTGTKVFKVGDARNLEEPNDAFDVVILQDILEHTDGYEIPVKEAIRVANKRVVITFWHLKNEDDPHINNDGGDTWGSWYDKREWENFLNKLGYPWQHDYMFFNNHDRDFYIIDKDYGTAR